MGIEAKMSREGERDEGFRVGFFVIIGLYVGFSLIAYSWPN